MSAPFTFLLAQQGRGDSLSESFRTHAGMGRDDVLLGLLMVVALATVLWATSRLLGLRRRRRVYHNPWQLFWDLCKAHRLNWSDRTLLGRLARHHRLGDPARLFLEARYWDEQTMGPAFALEFVRLRALRKQIFAGAAESHPAEPQVRSPSVRINDLGRGTDAKPAIAGQKAAGGTAAASPLLPNLPVPTLDVPPWTEARVES
jgi:hypothetical protein